MLQENKIIPHSVNQTGIDGSGKTTQIERLIKRLQDKNLPVFYSKAYTQERKKRYGKLIGRLCKMGETGNVLLTLIFKQFERQQCLDAMRASNEGQVIVCDRWDESYLAYHRQRGVLSRYPKMRNALLGYAFQGYTPQLTIFHDLPVEAAEQRMNSRGERDAFDGKKSGYHEMMRAGYRDLANERFDAWRRIDAQQSMEAISQEVWSLVENLVISDLLSA